MVSKWAVLEMDSNTTYQKLCGLWGHELIRGVYPAPTEQSALTLAREKAKADTKPFSTFIVVEAHYSLQKTETRTVEVIEARISPS